MATKIELQEEIKKLNHEHGLTFPVTDNYNELMKTLKDAKAAIPPVPTSNDDATKKSDKNAVYVWLKRPSYVDKDGTLRISGGFYKLDLAEYPRLANLPSTICERFDEVPMRKLSDIAKWFGIHTEKYKSDEELLKVLVTNPSLY